MQQDWLRSDLKFRAKDAFQKNYWAAVLVSLIVALLAFGGNAGGGSRVNFNVTRQYTYQTQSVEIWDEAVSALGYAVVDFLHSPFALFFAVAGIVWAIVLILLKILVGNCLEVGAKRFYIENLYSAPGLGKIFYGFQSGHYVNIAGTLFLRDLYVILWSLLFVIPGIIKTYQYRMVPYLLAEYPDMPRQEAFARSRDMMYGQKWNAFVLDLSFLPWQILSGITFGIVGVFYVNPYRDATDAELYDVLAGNMAAAERENSFY